MTLTLHRGDGLRRGFVSDRHHIKMPQNSPAKALMYLSEQSEKKPGLTI